MRGSLTTIVEKHKTRLLTEAVDAAQELAAKVVASTPVDTGALRMSWTFSLNAPKAVRVNPADRKKDEQSELISKGWLNVKAGDQLYFCNGQPYAERIEFEGYSPQAPMGMIRPNIALWDVIVRGEA